MDRWQSLIDQQLQEILKNGSAHLPGAGKPLDLGDDPNTPADMQLAYKIMRDNDITPDWIFLGKELDVEREALLDRLGKAYTSYLGQMGDAKRAGSASAEADAQDRWRTAQQKTREAAAQYNKKLLNYNLKLPSGLPQRANVDFERELKRIRGE